MGSETILVCTILFAAAFVQASLGFGFALVSMSALALFIDVVHAAGVVNIAGGVVIIGLTIALRRAVSWGYVRSVLPWAVFGVFIGVWALTNLDREFAVRLLGVCTLAIAAWNLFGSSAASESSRLWEAAAGLGSGLLSGAFNEGGPPLIAHLYRRPLAADTLKGTAQLIFLVTGLVRLPAAAAQGQITGSIWQDAAMALPFVGVGLLGGLRVSRYLDGPSFQRAAWVALLVLGAYLAVHG